MLELGILKNTDKVELLEGVLVEKMPKSPQHVLATKLARAALEKVLPTGWHLATQDPLTTVDSEPEPDLSVIRGSPFDYEFRHPGPEDAAVVIEVSLTSLAHDRSINLRLYARAGVAAYWVLNLQERLVESYSFPQRANDDVEYSKVERFGSGEAIPFILNGVEIANLSVDDLMPQDRNAAH